MMVTTQNLQETEQYAVSFVTTLEKQPPLPGATIIGLQGDLGAGKTSFVQGVGKAFGVQETMTSPTFVIQKRYPLLHKNRYSTLIHIDAYRLKSGAELEALGWKELIKDVSSVILIEWPENVKDILPDYTQILRFEYIDENIRTIHVGE